MKSKWLKRVGTLFLSLAVALTMGVTSFAAPVQDDSINVENVESGATVTAYQIVDEGNGSWVAANGVTIKDLSNPTAAEITAIATGITNGTITGLNTYNLTEANGIYSYSNPDAGMYLVLVSKVNSAKVYNPMIVSADYDAPDGSVDANTKFNSTAYAKSSEPTIDKSNVGMGNGNSNGGSAAAGDTVKFRIETTVPDYSDHYKNVVFNISDTLSAGLEEAKNIEVTVGNVVAVEGKDYTVNANGNTFTVEFDSDFILDSGNLNVEVTYESVVKDTAEYNFDANTNTATLTFTNAPGANGQPGPTTDKEDKTYVYTFGLDADLSVKNKDVNKKTHEVIKVDENGAGENQGSETSSTEVSYTNALAGATFGLFSDEACKTKVMSATTNANGYMSMTGLKEGTYYLKETAVPEDSGYALNDHVYEVVIAASYNNDGTLDSYTVTIDGEATSTYTATYEGGVITGITSEAETTFIVNSKVPGLPSTGGMGTYIFTILGVLIMVAAVVLLKRRNRSSGRA